MYICEGEVDAETGHTDIVGYTVVDDFGTLINPDANGKVRVGVTGAAPKAFRATDLETALSKDFSAKAIASVKVAPKGLMTDMHATAAYRAHLISVLAGRAVTAAK